MTDVFLLLVKEAITINKPVLAHLVQLAMAADGGIWTATQHSIRWPS